MSLSTRGGSYKLFSPLMKGANKTQNGQLEGASRPKIKIDELHIASLKKYIKDRHHEIPEEHHHRRDHFAVFTAASFGNLHLAIPTQLSSYKHFVKNIVDYVSGGNGMYFSAAVTHHNDFMYIYNFAYLKLLEAIDGSESAAQHFREYLKPNVMIGSAHIYEPRHLHDDINKPSFLMGILGYLLLDVVFSQDDKIPVESRVRAIAFIKENYDLKSIVAGFNEFSQGYELPAEDFPYHQFIPREFLNEDEKLTKNVLPMSKNVKLNEIFFRETLEGNFYHDFRAGISTLLTEHPRQAAQVILGLLHMNEQSYLAKIDKAAILEQVIGNINEHNAKQVLGPYASYRKGEVVCSPELTEWASKVVGIVSIDNYVNLSDLAEKDHDTQERILDQVRTIYELEKELVESVVSVKKIKSLENEEIGAYAAVLKVECDHDHEKFHATVNRHYRVLTAQLDKDNPADHAELKRLSEAYNCLMQGLLPSVNYQTNGHANGHPEPNGYHGPR